MKLARPTLRRFAPWLLVAAGGLALLPGTARLPLVDRDEPRFAEAARQMVATGDWVVPRFNGAPRYDKPPLTYWLMALGYGVAGVDELGARLHSIASAILVALVLWWAATRWFGPGPGLAAGLFWLLSLQVLIHGRAAVADLPMVLAVTVAGVILVDALGRPLATSRALALGAVLGLGFLAKGPVAVAVPLLALALCRFLFWRRPLGLGGRWPGPALLAFLVVVAPWAVLALVRTNGDFWRVGIGYHVVERGLQPFNGRVAVPLVYYLLTAFFSLFPWIAFALDVGIDLRRRWDARRALLVSWLTAPYVVFSLYATQLPHYVLPGFPAAFLLAGSAGGALGSGRAARAVRAVGLGLGGALALALLWAAARLPVPGLPTALGGAALVVVGLLAAAPLYRRLRPAPLAVALVAIATGFVLIAGGLRRVTPAIELERGFFPALPPGVPCAWQGFEEPSLVFYGRREWRPLAAWQPDGAPACAVVEERSVGLGALLGGGAGPATVPPAARRDERWLSSRGLRPRHLTGFDVARASWVELSAWMRPLTAERTGSPGDGAIAPAPAPAPP